MNDEIKEILDILKNCKDYDDEVFLIKQHSATLLLDYITNLQQENERLKEQLEYLRSGEYLNQVKWERDLNENLNQTLGTELEDYKLRCEKAIEIIEKEKENMGYAKYDSCLLLIENILQNGSDENE